MQAGDDGPLTIYMDFPTKINENDNPSAGRVDVDVGGTDFDHDTSGDGVLVCKWNDIRADSCVRNGNVFEISAGKYTALDAGTLYKLEITENNWETDGVLFPAADEDRAVIIKTYPDGNLQEAEHHDIIHIRERFSEFWVKFFGNNIDQENLIEIDMNPTQGVTGATAAIEIEFPTATLSGTQLFENDLNSGLYDGQRTLCDKFLANDSADAISHCKLYHGDNTLAIPRPARIVMFLNPSTLVAGTKAFIGIPKFINPSTAHISADILVYTRTSPTDTNVLANYMVFNTAIITWPWAVGSTDKPMQTTGNWNVEDTGVTWTFSWDTQYTPAPNFSNQQNTTLNPTLHGRMIYVFDVASNLFTMEPTSTIVSPGTPSVRVYATAGWMTFTPSADIAATSVETWTFNNMNNANYVPITAVNVYCIKAIMMWDYFIEQYYNFVTTPTPWAASPITPDSLGQTFGTVCGGNGHNRLHVNGDVPFVITFQASKPIPDGGSVSVTFPASDFQSVRTW